MWRRLDRRMLILLPLQEFLRNLPWLIVLLIAGAGSGSGPYYGLAGLIFSITAGTLRWFTTSYRIAADQVQVRRGLFRRQTLTVLRDRLRTVDLTANILHRMFGLASITMGTGRSDRKDDRGLKLDGLSTSDAAWVRQELLHRAAGVLPTESNATTGAPELARQYELARWEPRWIGYGPFTLSGAITVLALVGFGAEIINDDHLHPARLGPVHAALQALGSDSTALTALALLVVAAMLITLASTLGYVLAFWNFRLTRQAGTLQVTRGLLTTRVISIGENRLRGVEFSEPLLLRLVHGARCIAIATGLRVGRGAERGGSMLVPPAPRAVAEGVTATILGTEVPVRCDLIAHGPTARRRRYTRVLLVTVPTLAILLVAWRWGVVPAWPWQLTLTFLILGLPLAADRYRSLGHAVVGDRLVTRSGSLVRRRCVLSSDGIIGWNLHQSFFQRRAQVVNLVATTAAGRQAYRMQDLTLPEAVRVAEEARPGLLSPFFEPDLAAVPDSAEASTPQ
ncbi:MAG TPA: PH domain-containing protein [Candidatus Dormibacteraeota bacterium]|nr:PH domain-containing protein [Candidatus Dormibacteraeota bacterium]